MLVQQLDEYGKVLKTKAFPIKVDQTAKLSASGNSKNSGEQFQATTSSSNGAGTIKVSDPFINYTATEVVVVIFIYYYDSDGNLIDVETKVSRFPRTDIMPPPDI
ncbi:hypothetical protein GCM10007894_16520 [Paraferrimonas haliotis]|uniref:Uncharacterized protein n=1 Tax=Paraferrimonas haliotis TaxID=2013866 RepID=A0AA37WYC8_9GAMM|nr:hypothetical protein GCM10007894_16520 [Paraferrimonas haliotis]